jgi:hypothetical protein
MKIEEILKRITVREILAKIKTLSIVLLVINVIVLFISLYGYILFGFIIGVDKIFAIVLASFFLFVFCMVLAGNGY